MRGILSTLIIVAVIAGVGFFYGYNSLNSKEEGVFQAWADVESTLQRRADLIPNLVESVKGYAAHEKELIEFLGRARASAMSVQMKPGDLSNAQAMEQFAAAQGEVGVALGRAMITVENYPDLKASQNFLQLQHQLEGTENRINVARQRYNDAVRTFNTALRRYPEKWFNENYFQLEHKEYFKAATSAKEVPKVSFTSEQ